MKPPIITLLTDFGTTDHYVASMKGVILSINPLSTFIDISHHIKPHDIREGAFVLAGAYSHFPKGTIHLAIVDPGVGGPRRPILVKTLDHFFVGPDNGIFSLVALREKVEKVIVLNNRDYFLPQVRSTFQGRDLFAPVAAHLSLRKDCEGFGCATRRWTRLRFPSPGETVTGLSGEIIHIDAFGNLVSNIDETRLFRFLKDRPFSIRVGRKRIQGLKTGYWEGKRGEVMALIGSGGFLEIAVREGNAGGGLKMKRGDPVRIIIEKPLKPKGKKVGVT